MQPQIWILATCRTVIPSLSDAKFAWFNFAEYRYVCVVFLLEVAILSLLVTRILCSITYFTLVYALSKIAGRSSKAAKETKKRKRAPKKEKKSESPKKKKTKSKVEVEQSESDNDNQSESEDEDSADSEEVSQTKSEDVSASSSEDEVCVFHIYILLD